MAEYQSEELFQQRVHVAGDIIEFQVW